MKVTAVYFSPTGNTKRTVEAMAGALDPEFETIDLTGYENRTAAKEFGPDELVIFGMPVYGGRIPETGAQRLEGLQGRETPCILAATYGNRHYDDALAEMEDIAKAHGFLVKGAAALVGRHTYGKIQTDRPDEKDLEADREFAVKAAAREGVCQTIPGNRPYKPGMGRGHFFPLTSDSCVGCGICKDGCPVAAIDDSFQVNPEVCISCFRCIRNCPVGAKNMDTDAYRAFAEDFTKKLAARRENEYFL